MKKSLLAILVHVAVSTAAQDTFSILAFDSISGEIGAAGASCVNLLQGFGTNADFIAEIFPDTGGVMTQAAYTGNNQLNARKRLRDGYAPDSVIKWLSLNDAGGNPYIRQYGVIRKDAPGAKTAAYTGTNCMNYKNHIVGPNYTIHGNILLGQHILDSMEARFLRQPGDLACKLMAALQGANVIGADTRCAPNNSSSLFAFLKVTLPTDTFGKPNLILGVRTASVKIEPIDSLQKLFDAVRVCTVSTAGIPGGPAIAVMAIYPNPFTARVSFQALSGELAEYFLADLSGRIIREGSFVGSKHVDLIESDRGLYLVELRCRGQRLRGKVILY
jgi:uncharacterized Ntn-hydrolase superfamily protein